MATSGVVSAEPQQKQGEMLRGKEGALVFKVPFAGCEEELVLGSAWGLL